MSRQGEKEGNGSLIAVAMIIIGVFLFLYGPIRRNTESTGTLILGFISTILIMIGAGMLLYDRVFEPPKKFDRLNYISVNVPKANVRSSPSSSSEENIVGQVEMGTDLKVLESRGGWAKIEYNSMPAYISLGIVKKWFVKERKPYRWPYLWYWMTFFGVIYIGCLVSALLSKNGQV